jgi:6-phosphogluconolactonase (cycloisomerase 2 family)
VAIDHVGSAQRVDYVIHRGVKIIEIFNIGHEQHELVAAKRAKPEFRPRQRAQPIGDSAQQLVAVDVTHGVVDMFEIVNVQHGQGQLLSGRAGNLLTNHFL